MEYKTFPGKTYIITSPNGGTVYDADGRTLVTAEANEQKAFVATTGSVTVSDTDAVITEVFKGAPALGGSGGGGGVSITFDEVPTADSTNAVTSGGVYTALLHQGNSSSAVKVGKSTQAWQASVAVGVEAGSGAHMSTVVGYKSKSSDYCGTAVGCEAFCKGHSNAIGYMAKANALYSAAYGYNTQVADKGVTVIAAWNDDASSQTLLYLIGAGSTLATTYEDGEACMGYVVKDTAGNVSACGTQKLSALFPNNTAWATMALGLDDETPTPFLPTGATDPIEFPETEELTEE